jgi:hypothetical protein
MTNEHFDPEPDDAGQPEIDALLDGEPVDRQALRVALADAEAREYLVEVLLLRGLTRTMGPAGFTSPAATRAGVGQPVRWLAAAAVVVMSVAAGFAYGRQSQVIAPSSVEVSLDTVVAPPPAPEPTRAIRFEPGVNWTSTSGRR